MLIILIKVKPFKNRSNYYLEVFNELSILSLQYCMIFFSKVNNFSDIRAQTGWALLAIVLLNFGVNCIFILFNMLMDLWSKIKIYCWKS